MAAPQRADPPTPAAPRRSSVKIAVICLWISLAAIAGTAGVYRYKTAYRRFAMKQFGDNVRYVELRPTPDGPPVRMTNPEQIAAVRAWLAGAEASAGKEKSARPADCPLVITFGDGHEERLAIGRLGTTGPDAEEGDVEIRWGGYVRYANPAPIARIIHDVSRPHPFAPALGKEGGER